MEQTRAEAAEPAITKADLGRAVVGFVDELAKAIPESVVDFIGRVAEAARDPENLAKLQAGITMVADIIETELKRYDRDPRSFLYDEMLAGPAVLLIAKVRIDDDSVLLDGLEFAISENDLLRDTRRAVADSGALSSEQRERLLHGLEQLAGQKWTLACDSLLTGVEGMIWDAATERGVIDSERRLTDPSTRRRLIRSVNGLVSDEALEGLRPSYRHFLDRQLFAAAGNDLRHGRSGRDSRAGALFAAAAILGWLDHSEKTELMVRFAGNLDRFVEELAEEIEIEEHASLVVDPALPI